MAVEWRVKATEMVNCNCAYGCPCQFNALPTYGDCRAACGYEIEEGHFGAVRLDGLRAAILFSWPGPIHLGNGTMQVIVDERADAAQRDALIKILTGEETDEMATGWWVFAAMSPTKLAPRFEPIEYEIDIAARRGRFRVPGVVETVGEPIRNPVTGAEHSVRIDLPHGFEFRTAEMGSGTTKATAAIALPGIENTHIHFANIHLSNKGVVDQSAHDDDRRLAPLRHDRASPGVVVALAQTYLLLGAGIEDGDDGIILRDVAVEVNAG